MKTMLPTLLLLLAASAAAAQSPTEAVREFWQACVQQVPGLPAGASYRVRAWGADQPRSERLLEVIASGEKTATFTSPWIYAGDAAQTPVVDGYTVATDFEGRPRLVLRTAALEELRYDEITEEHSRHEGPGARTLEAWRAIHWSYFGRLLAPLGREPAEDMPVTVEHFEVVCPPPAAAAIRRMNPEGMYRPGGYAQVVTVEGPVRWVVLSGQVGIRADRSVPEDLAGQAAVAFDNVRRALAAAGATPRDVVEVEIYIVDLANVDPTPVFRAFRDMFPAGSKPASTVLGVPALVAPGYKLEVKVTAAVRD